MRVRWIDLEAAREGGRERGRGEGDQGLGGNESLSAKRQILQLKGRKFITVPPVPLLT